MQFRVPGLETFELELPAETKVRERLRDLGSETGADVVDFWNWTDSDMILRILDAVSLRRCEEDGEGILQHRA